jgi:glycosyltransferase involved in cell wall biosynthesis
VDSLLRQNWTNLEIIVSDDASADGTRAILASYRNDTRFRIFLQETNLGAVGNFDFAVRQAKGDFIAFSDQDDVWLPEKISTLHHAIGDAWMVYSDSLLVDEYGNSLGKQLSGLRNMYSGRDTSGFVFSNVVWGHAMMINRRLLEKVLPIPDKVPHDIWFAATAASQTGIRYVDTVLTHYRQHSHTVTTTIAQKATTRPKEKRYHDFENQLRWIRLLHLHADPSLQSFFARLEKLYAEKSKGRFVWPLFFFLIKHQYQLFRFTRKSYVSRVIEIRKLSRGERII